MTRRLSLGTAAVVAWIAREMIYLGQNIIRTAYEWLKWSERL
ncbi:MAG TPA: hypothetical protein VK626_01670 [Nitrospiraceae bacterium]|nr:hypothetical protein [Nitrospiraceae bacterium]